MTTGHDVICFVIVAESLLEARLLDGLATCGAHGWTVTAARGQGPRNRRVSEVEGGNIRVETLVSDAARRGVTVLAGGNRPADLPKGYFFEPTLLAGVTPELPVYHEEIFGPVLPVIDYEDLDQVIALANATPYGLAAYVWTNDLKAATRAAEGLEFGMIGINEWAPHATEAPFGGWKQSGLGHESGSEGLDEYLETKLVSLGGL